MTWPYKEGSLVRLNPDGCPDFKPYHQPWQQVRTGWKNANDSRGDRYTYADELGTTALVTKVIKYDTYWAFTPLLFDGRLHALDYMNHWELVRGPDDGTA